MKKTIAVINRVLSASLRKLKKIDITSKAGLSRQMRSEAMSRKYSRRRVSHNQLY